MAGQPSARREVRIRPLASEDEDTNATDMQILPHEGNPGVPRKQWNKPEDPEVVSDQQRFSADAEGYTTETQVNVPYRYGINDIWLPGLFGQADWIIPTGIDVDIDLSGADTMTAAVTTGGRTAEHGGILTGTGKFSTLKTAIDAALAPGRSATFNGGFHVWVVTDDTNNTTANLKKYRVKSVDNDNLTFAREADGGPNLATASASAKYKIYMSGFLWNGIVAKYYQTEIANLALNSGSGRFNAGDGGLVTAAQLNIQSRQKTAMSVTFAHRNARGGNATFGTGTQVEVNQSSLRFQTGVNFQDWRIGGAHVPAMKLTGLDNNFAVGATPGNPLGADGPDTHTRDGYRVNGTLTALMSDETITLDDLADNQTIFFIDWMNQRDNRDGKKHAYAWNHLACLFDDSDQQGGGTEGRMSQVSPWMATRDSDYLITSTVTRFEDLPQAVA